MGQLSPLVFAWEDLAFNNNSDGDYNDLIFSVEGIIGSTTSLNDLVIENKDWRNSPLGRELITFTNTQLNEPTPETEQPPASLNVPNPVIKTEGTIAINGNADFDGIPTNPNDDAFIHTNQGFTINGRPILPVQRNPSGNPILDNNGKPILVADAVTVAPGYIQSNAPNNLYAGLVPPKIVAPQTVTVPNWNEIKTDALGNNLNNPGINFNPTGINNAQQWTSRFPAPGTTSQPTIVKIANGGLRIPANISLSNYIVIVENGDINFNGNNHNFNNVVLVANNGNINLANLVGIDVSILASGAINSNAGVIVGGKSQIASGRGNINFNGSTRTTAIGDELEVIANGNITVNGNSNLRGNFLSTGTFNFNGNSTLYGAIGAKGNIIFNGNVIVIGTGESENSSPRDIILNPTVIEENVGSLSVVGVLSTIDPDLGDSHNYSLVSGIGDGDNNEFTIAGNFLKINNPPNFEAKSNYNIRVRSTDAGGLSVEKTLAIEIANINEAPINITLNFNSVEENQPSGTIIGTFDTEDPDREDRHTYTLITENPNNNTFQIINNQLQIKNPPDFENQTNADIRVRSTDAGGLSVEKNFAIEIVNDTSDDAPKIDLSLSQDTGTSHLDRITNNPHLQGKIISNNQIITLIAIENNNTTNLISSLQNDRTFTYNPGEREGQRNITIIATDNFHNQTTLNYNFTLDTTNPTINLISPLTNTEYSNTVRLIGSSAPQTTLQLSLDDNPFIPVESDNFGQFDQKLSSSVLTQTHHQANLKAEDLAGNTSQTNINFSVSPQFSVSPSDSNGWASQQEGEIFLNSGNSYLVSAFAPIEIEVSPGSSTVSFDLETHLTSSATPDRFLVYLVDTNNPETTLLDSGSQSQAIFSLAKGIAEYPPGLVRYDSQTVTIDLISLKNVTTGKLIFQLLDGDKNSPSWVKISQITNRFDPEGKESPLFPLEDNTIAVGGELNTNLLTPNPLLEASFHNVYLSGTQQISQLQINNHGPSIPRQIAVLFPNLPTGVTLNNPSGLTDRGIPYLNLEPALENGGLATGEYSQPVRVIFDNPHLIPFPLEPLILAASNNNAPIFPAIAPIAITPGSRLEIPLMANDVDGDRVSFRLQSFAQLPTGQLNSQGTLIIAPTPEDLGNYQLELIASDGILETTQILNVNVVADPITTTRISGIIQNTERAPLSGLTVGIGEVEVLTAEDGSFTLEFNSPLPADTLKVHGEEINSELVYPFIAEKLPLVLGHRVYDNYHNIIDRPIYLPPLDVANGKVVDFNADTLVTTPNIPGASVLVRSNTLLDQTGNPFTGKLSITEVPVNLTPAALPSNLIPDLVVTIQPGEMVFTTPAPLSLPNRIGWEPGVEMDLWSINPITGDFDKVGKGRVSADGSTIETVEGGIRNSSWHFFAPIPIGFNPEGDPRNLDPSGNNCEEDKQASSQVQMHTGGLIETHELVTYQSRGETIGFTLTYDSLRASNSQILNVTYDQINPSNISSDFRVRRYLNFVSGITIHTNGFDYQDSLVLIGNRNQIELKGVSNVHALGNEIGTLAIGMGKKLTYLPSGRYDYTLTSGILYLDPDFLQGSLNSQPGKLVHINTINSPFGSGWGLSGWQELVENADGSVLLIDGNGTEDVFEAPTNSGAAYVSPQGDFSTLEKLADGSWKRTGKDKRVYTFNQQGQISTMADPVGKITQYLYDEQSRLSQIIDAVGLATSFVYNEDNRVREIIDPAGRITTLTYDNYGNLQRLGEPDGTSRSWSYDRERNMIGEVDKRGLKEETFYNRDGRAIKALRTDNSTVQIAPVQKTGLSITQDGINNIYGTYADGSGNVSVSKLDKSGQLIVGTDGVGQLPTKNRNEDNLVTETVDSRGNNTEYEYDENGNVVVVKDSLSPHLTYGLPSTSQAVTDIDLNQDGWQDVVSFNSNKTFSVLLGSETGIQSNPTNYQTGGSFNSSILADVNGDNFIDVTTINSEEGVEFYSGNNRGSFSSSLKGSSLELEDLSTVSLEVLRNNQTSELFENNPIDLAENNRLDLLGLSEEINFRAIEYIPLEPGVNSYAVEINGDENLDLITLDGDFISVRLGNGNESYYYLGGVGGAIAVGDVNSDGYLDLVVNALVGGDGYGGDGYGGDGYGGDGYGGDGYGGDDNYYLKVFLGRGDGSFDNSVDTLTFEKADFLALKDLNGDGYKEIISYEILGREINVWFNDGVNYFLGYFNLHGWEDDSYIGFEPLGSDEYLDVVLANQDLKTVSLFFSSEDYFNGYQDNRYNFSYAINYLGFARLDEDSSQDLIAKDASQTQISVVRNRDSNILIDSLTTLASAKIFVANLDGDDVKDLIVTNESRTTSEIILGQTNGSYLNFGNISSDKAIDKLSLINLDNDNLVEIVTVNSEARQLGITWSNPTRPTTILTANTEINYLVEDDLDGDEYKDLIIANNSRQQISVFSGSSGGYLAGENVYFLENIPFLGSKLAIADLDKNGFKDLIINNSSPTSWAVSLNDGSNRFTSWSNYSLNSSAERFGLKDVNNDGYLDLLAANNHRTVFDFWLGSATGSFSHFTALNFSNSPDSLLLADLDGNNYLDVLSLRNSQLEIRLNSGGSLSTPTYYTLDNASDYLSVGDLNGNGRFELLLRQENSTHLSIVTDGNVTTNYQSILSNSKLVYLDLNRDGLGDLIDFDSFLGRAGFSLGKLLDVGVRNEFNIGISPRLNWQIDLDLNGVIDEVELVRELKAVAVSWKTQLGEVYRFDYTLTGEPIGAAIGDFNGDGYDDFLVATANNNYLTLLVGDGKGGVVGNKYFNYEPVFNRLVATVDELGRKTFSTYDPITGKVISRRQVVGEIGGDDDVVTNYSYTALGLLDKEIDALGRVTDYDYDERGNLIRVVRARGTLRESVTGYEYDLAGNQIAVVDENGVRTEFEYDKMNRLLKTIYAVGTSEEAFTTNSYDNSGNLIATVNELGHLTEYEYDGFGRLLATILPSLDGEGSLLSKSVYDGMGNLIATVDARGNKTKYKYDERNRLWLNILGDGSEERYVYDFDNHPQSSFDSLGRADENVYDARGRLIRATDASVILLLTSTI
jgi:YD repeat-containing protein